MPRLFVLELNLDLPAFKADDGGQAEIARLLRMAAARTDRGIYAGLLYDRQKNLVGTYRVKGEPDTYWEEVTR